MSATGTEAKVCEDIAARQQTGIAEYGTVAEKPLTHRQLLQHAYEEALDLAVYLRRAMDEQSGWMPIETAPKDGTEIIVYCQPAHGLPHMASVCAWHDDAGFCVDELREPSLWIPLPK